MTLDLGAVRRDHARQSLLSWAHAPSCGVCTLGSRVDELEDILRRVQAVADSENNGLIWRIADEAFGGR